MGVVSRGDGYYPPVQGDRERRRGPRNRPADATMKRAEQGGGTYQEEAEKEPERRAPEGRMHPQSQEDSVLRGNGAVEAQRAGQWARSSWRPGRGGQKACPWMWQPESPHDRNKGDFAGVGGNVDRGGVNGL